MLLSLCWKEGKTDRGLTDGSCSVIFEQKRPVLRNIVQFFRPGDRKEKEQGKQPDNLRTASRNAVSFERMPALL